MNVFPIAASDMDVVIGIIAVVGWILSQVLGRKKGGDPSAAPPDGEPTPSANPQDELRKFFEEMGKTVKPQAEVKPVPPPPPLPSRAHTQQKRERPIPRIRKQEEPRPQVLTRPEPVVMAPSALFNEPEIAQRYALPATVTSSANRVSLLMPEIQDPTALRKMIITMEVLGKPVALRNGAPTL